MKRLLGNIFVMVCALCLLCANTAHAQLHSASIKGETQVVAGRAYTYLLTVNATGRYDVFARCGGALEMLKCPEFSSTSGGLKSVEIEVRVNKDAKPGDTGTIIMIGSGTEPDSIQNFGIESVFTATVIAPTPQPTSEPPTPEPPSAMPSAPPPTPQPSATSAPRKEQPLAPAPSVFPNAQMNEQELSDRIATLGEGTAVTFTAASSTNNVSLLALSALKQKQSIITLDFGTYTCTIDGALLGSLPDEMPPIDLSMSMTKDASLSHAAGNKDSYQLHFAHSGVLPGVFGYSFPAATHQPGDTLYLYYYYDTSGIIEYKHSATVDENGWVTFDIYHCSSYFVTDVPLDGMATAPSSPRQINAVSEITEEHAPLTPALSASDTPSGVTLPALIGALLIAVGATIFVTLKLSSRRQK